MTPEEARLLLAEARLDGDRAFSVIDYVHRYWHEANQSPEALDLVVRLAARRTELDRALSGANDLIDDVLRFAGLFPYMSAQSDAGNRLAKAAMSFAAVPDLVFHRGQIDALRFLLRGNSLILSAPTSFGKSRLVDVLIVLRNPSNVVIVVPTLALLDEYRRRLKATFRQYQIITRATEAISGARTIFLGTQERIEDRNDIKEVDLFVIDEFYKLDLKKSDERAASLNKVMSRYAAVAKQVYLLGPSISSVTEVEETANFSISFLRSNFSPVAVDVERVRVDKTSSKELQLHHVLDKTSNESTLIYSRSPRSAYKIGLDVIKERKDDSKTGRVLAEWVRENYHSRWILADCLERGYGIHHGRIPRAVAQYQIALFNEGYLTNMICTSSMIEGVNTKAKNVVIYDNYISTDKLDRFTFDNIKGRAGRMFQHFIGKVFLFGDAPLGEEMAVEIPLFNGFENASDEVIATVPPESLSRAARARRDNILRRSQLSSELLARWGRYGINGLNDLAEELIDRRGDRTLVWGGQGTFDEIEAIFDLLWRHLTFSKHGMKSPRQAAFLTTRLRSSSSIKEFLEALTKSEDPLKYQIEIDDGLNFLRAAEFTLPQLLMAVQDVALEVQVSGLDYSVLAGRLPMWFAPRDYQSLEENGLPYPLTRRLDISASVLPDASTLRRLQGHAKSPVDRDLLRRWAMEELGT
jgi:hypothetical protein